MSFPIPEYRSPLRDVASSLEGGINSIALGLTQARVTRENRDAEARQGAAGLANTLAQEIARLSAIPNLDEEGQARLAELVEASQRVQSISAATGSGEAANMWAAFMQESPITAMVGGAAGSATRLERDLQATQRVQDANFGNISNFYSFLMGADINDANFLSRLNAQLAVMEAVASSGFALPEAAMPMMKGIPDAIMGMRSALTGDPRYAAHLDRLDRIAAAAADRAGVELQGVRNDVMDSIAANWRSTGQYDPAMRNELMAFVGYGEEQFDSLTREYQRNGQRQTELAMGMAELGFRLLGTQADAADAALAMDNYRNNREKLLDNVNDASSAAQYAFGAAMSGDVNAIAMMIADIENPDSERGEHYRAAGLTVDRLKDFLKEASLNTEWRSLQRDTSRAELDRALAAANRGLFTDSLQAGADIMRGAAILHGPDGVAAFYDEQPDHVKALMGPREQAIATMKMLARTNDLVVGEPLRNHALGQAQMLMSLPVSWNADGSLSDEGYNMLTSRLLQVQSLLEEHMGPEFTNTFVAGAWEMLQQGATRDAWEMHQLVANVHLLRSQAGLNPDGTPRAATANVDFKAVRDGYKDAINAVESNSAALMSRMSQDKCVTLEGSGPGGMPAATPGANAGTDHCKELAARFNANQVLLAGFANELSGLARYQLYGDAGTDAGSLPVDMPTSAPVAPPVTPSAEMPPPRQPNPYVAPDAASQPTPRVPVPLPSERPAASYGGQPGPAPAPALAPAPAPAPAPVAPAGRQAGFAASAGYDSQNYPYVTPEFESRVSGMASSLGEAFGVDIDPVHLLDIMNLESSLDPTEVNDSGASGLIQFMGPALRDLGVEGADDDARLQVVRDMSVDEQLDLVEKYFAMRNRQFKLGEVLQNTDDPLRELYMAVLWPAAIGQGADFVLYERGSAAYRQNAGLDIDRDGKVTAGEATNRVRQKAPGRSGSREEAGAVEVFTPEPDQSAIVPSARYAGALAQKSRDDWWWEDEFYADEDPMLEVLTGVGTRLQVKWSVIKNNPDAVWTIVDGPREPTVEVRSSSRVRTRVPKRQAAAQGLLPAGNP